jgi:hypothetical protein
LEEYLDAYLDGADLRRDPKGPLFRSLAVGTGRPLSACAVRSVADDPPAGEARRHQDEDRQRLEFVSDSGDPAAVRFNTSRFVPVCRATRSGETPIESKYVMYV